MAEAAARQAKAAEKANSDAYFNRALDGLKQYSKPATICTPMGTSVICR
jgi:hypothetical protein